MTQSHYLPTLDGWRALAILAVLACHANAGLFSSTGAFPNEGVHVLLWHGAVGVDLFFGLSGFLIGSRLLLEHRRSGRIGLGGFYARRAFRILPCYFAYLLTLRVLGRAVGLRFGESDWWACVGFVRNYMPQAPAYGWNDWYTAHFWSLAVEEHFYLVVPGLLVALGVTRARRPFGLLALGLGAWGLVERKFHFLDGWLAGVTVFQRSDVRLDGLLWGCWLALLLDEPARREWLARRFTPGLWLVLAVAFAADTLGKFALTPAGAAIAIPFLIAWTVLNPGSWPGRFLELAPLRAIGRLSYSLYVWQQLFLLPEREQSALPLGILQRWPCNLAAAFACAAASYFLIEQPMIRLGRRLMARPAPTPARGPHRFVTTAARPSSARRGRD